jgi:hypothetical protein
MVSFSKRNNNGKSRKQHYGGKPSGEGYANARDRARDKAKTTAANIKRDSHFQVLDATFEYELERQGFELTMDIGAIPAHIKSNFIQDSDYDVTYIRPRTVQTGAALPANKFAHTRENGRTDVSADYLRKPTDRSWADHKEVVRTLQKRSKFKKEKSRVDKRASTMALREELDVYLKEQLGIAITVIHFNNMTQRKRAQGLRTLGQQLAYQPKQCYVVPDAKAGQWAIVFAYKVVWIPFGPTIDSVQYLRDNWRTLFAGECQDAEAERLAHAMSSLDISCDSPVAEGVCQSLDLVVNSAALGLRTHSPAYFVAGLLGLADTGDIEPASWAAMMGHLASYAVEWKNLQLNVKEDRRVEYVMFRLMSALAAEENLSVTAVDFLKKLANLDCVQSVLKALSTCKFTGTELDDIDDAATQAFSLSQIMDAVRPVLGSGVLGHGTITAAMLAVCSAAYTLIMCKDDWSTLSVVKEYAFDFVGVPSIRDARDAASAFKRFGPSVFGALQEMYATRSLRVLLPDTSDTLHVRLSKLMSAHADFLNGSFPTTFFVSRLEYQNEAFDLYAAMTRKMNNTYNPPPALSGLYTKLCGIHNDCLEAARGEWRIAPYSVVVYGPSCIGKTTISSHLVRKMYYTRYKKFMPPETVYTVQATDQYASGYDMSKKVVIMDDVANPKAGPGFTIPNPTGGIIDIINNTRTPTNQAGLEGKGKVFWAPDFVMMSTNVHDLGAACSSHCPISILRRPAVFLKPTVKPQYTGDGRVAINGDLVPKDANGDFEFLPDCWTFHMYKFVPVEEDHGYMKVTIMADADICDVAEYLDMDSTAHFKRQETLARSNTVRKGPELSIAELRGRHRDVGPMPEGGRPLEDIPIVPDDAAAVRVSRAHDEELECADDVLVFGPDDDAVAERAPRAREGELECAESILVFGPDEGDEGGIVEAKAVAQTLNTRLVDLEGRLIVFHKKFSPCVQLFRTEPMSWRFFGFPCTAAGQSLVPEEEHYEEPMETTTVSAVQQLALINAVDTDTGVPHQRHVVVSNFTYYKYVLVVAPFLSAKEWLETAYSNAHFRTTCKRVVYGWVADLPEYQIALLVPILAFAMYLAPVVSLCVIASCVVVGVSVALRRTYRRATHLVDYMPMVAAVSSILGFAAMFGLYSAVKAPKTITVKTQFDKMTSATPVMSGDAQGLVEMAMGSKGHTDTMPVQTSRASTTTRCEDLMTKVASKMYWVTLRCDSALIPFATFWAFPVKTGVLIWNTHCSQTFVNHAKAMPRFGCTIELMRAGSGAKGVRSSQTFPFYPDALVLGPQDVCAFYYQGPVEFDFTDYFPLKSTLELMNNAALPVNQTGSFLWRFDNPTNFESPLSLCKSYGIDRPRLQNSSLQGKDFNLPIGVFVASRLTISTRSGDCGSPFIVDPANGGCFIGGILSGAVVSPRNRAEEYSVFTMVTRELLVLMEQTYAGYTQAPALPRLVGQAATLDLVPRQHPELPVDVPGMTLVGTLVANSGVSRGANTASQNTFRSRLRLGVFANLPAVLRICGEIAHETARCPRDMKHYARPIERMARNPLPDKSAVINVAKNDLIAQRLTIPGWDKVNFMSLFEAVNGSGEIKAYPMNTRAGFGYPLRKSEYFYTVCSDPTCACEKFHPAPTDYVAPGRTNYYPKPELEMAIYGMLESLARCESDLAVFRASLKDEAVPLGKDKVRAFFVGSMAFNLVLRMFYTPIFNHAQNDMLKSECAVGIDIMSDDWESLMTGLEEYSLTKRLAGDYSNYDNSIPESLIQAAYGSVYRVVCEACPLYKNGVVSIGPNAYPVLNVLHGVLFNMLNPIYIFLGTVYRASGTNPSGVAITSYINSLINSLVHRVAFYEKNPELMSSAGVVDENGFSNFGRNVRLLTYGDDVVGAVVEHVEGVQPINNLDVQLAATGFGMKFGPIDKTSLAFPPYYTVHDASFLKCRSVFVPELNRRVGCIEMASIRKALTFERNATMEARRNTAASVLRLFFPHAVERGDPGYKQFNDLRAEMLDVIYPSTVTNSDALPTYESILESLKGGKGDDADLMAQELAWDGVCYTLSGEWDVLSPPVAAVPLASRTPSAGLFSGFGKGFLNKKKSPTAVTQGLEKQLPYGAFGFQPTLKFSMSTIPEATDITTETEFVQTRVLNDIMEQVPAEIIGKESTGALPIVEDTSAIARFLERPVRLRTHTWGVGQSMWFEVNPWSILSVPSVVSKLNNYSRLRADVRIRVNVSATPFHYGKLLVAYRPHPGCLSTDDPMYNSAISLACSDPITNHAAVVSQLPGVQINPCYTDTVELICPYMHYKPGISIPDDPPFGRIGTLMLRSVAPLRHANSGTDSVTVEILASLENVTIDVPTAVTQGFTMESAARVAKNVLKKGAYATRLAAEWAPTVSNYFAMLGFSRPLALDTVSSVRNIPFNVANYDVADTCDRLALSANSEMVIDGDALGCAGEDQLVVSTIASRPCIIGVTSWEPSDIQFTFLYGCLVTPQNQLTGVYSQAGHATVLYGLQTPCSFVASMMTHWKCDMVYRFEVVASPYHKGRLRIWYEPNLTNVTEAEVPYNLLNSTIINLAENPIAEVRVPWNNIRDVAQTRSPFEHTHSQGLVGFNSAVLAGSPLTCNGQVVCEVLSPLTGPTNDSVVTLLVTSWAENFVGYGPRLPAASATGEGIVVDGIAVPYTPQGFDNSGGDAIGSLRQLFKRYVRTYVKEVRQGTNLADFQGVTETYLPMYLPLPGEALESGSLYRDGAGYNRNWTNATFVSLASSCFCLASGSVRWKVGYSMFDGTPRCAIHPYIARATVPINGVSSVLVDARLRQRPLGLCTTTGTDPEKETALVSARGRLLRGLDEGAQLGNDTRSSTDVFDVEFPFVSTYRAFNPRLPFNSSDDGRDHMNVVIGLPLANQSTNSFGLLDILTAAGEDYNVHGFVHAPMYLSEIPYAL